MDFPHNEIKINSVLLMMSLKLTIKVVAFFLGHPVYLAYKQAACEYIYSNQRTNHFQSSPRNYTLRRLLVKFFLVIYFPCKIVLIYQECVDSACRSHNEITRQRGQINTIGVGLLRTRSSGKFYTVCVIILHGFLCV